MGAIRNLRIKGYVFIRSKYYKKFMSRLYGWGASIVILGALFKINHYPYADEFLLVGLGMEAIIFFFSAFEKPHIDPDWSMVYPELKAFYHGDGIGKKSDYIRPTKELDNLLRNANIDQELIDRLGKGLEKLSGSTSKMSDVADAALASNDYAEKIKLATNSADELHTAYQKTAESLQADSDATLIHGEKVMDATDRVTELAESYEEANKVLKNDISATEVFANNIRMAGDSAKELSDQYKESTEKITRSADALDFSNIEGTSYNEQLKKIAGTLSSLNQLYELQLQSSNQQVESSTKLHSTMNNFLNNMTESAEKMIEYKQNMDQLNEKMAALNEVYANMLNAMNVKK
jgi:gliding motility-associated protein GldL